MPKIWDILSMFPQTGRRLKENGTAVNIVDEGTDVNVTDQISEVVDLLLSIPIQDITIVTNTNLYDNVITISCAAEPTNGSLVCLKEDISFYQGFIISHVANGVDWDITLDSPLDFAYTTAGGCSEREANLAKAVGSLAAPVIASVSPSGLNVNWHLNRMMGSLTHTVAAADNLFGGLAALVYGVVFRRVNGKVKNIFNAKSNGDLKLRMFDVPYTDRGNPASTLYGTNFRRSFNGQDKNGVVQDLVATTDDTFEIVIQDPLNTGGTIETFYMCVQGHVVDDVKVVE